MKIIIFGANDIGLGIAKQLSKEENTVTVVDSSSEQLQMIGDTLDVSIVNGFPSHPDVLNSAGTSNAEMIIAVTESDEVNMIICEVAHSIFNVPIKIARIRHEAYLNPSFKDLYRHDHIPIDHIISPEREVADAIINRLHVPGAMDTLPLVDRQIKVIEASCTDSSPVIGYSLADLKEHYSDLRVAIIGILRDENFMIPGKHDKVRSGDYVYFVADRNDVEQTMRLLGHKEKEAHRVVIVGGGNIGLFVAESLEKDSHDIRAKLIELGKERAEKIACKLETTTVINGDSLDQEILLEANIGAAETIIAVTNDDEVNILSSLLGKKLGCQTAFSLVNKGVSYGPLISSIGIDVIIDPKEMTVSSILQHTRRGRVRAAHSICSGAAEIMELEAFKGASVVGRSIGDLVLPSGIKIGAIRRDDTTLIPDSKTVISAGDKLVVIALTNQVRKVDKIFSSRFDYF